MCNLVVLNPVFDVPRHCAAAIRAAKATVDPFRHTIIDDFLPDSCLMPIIREALEVDIRDNYGIAKDRRCEYRKLAFHPNVVGDIFNQIAINLSSPEVVCAIGEKFHYKGLVADPTYYGGGLHMTMRGGFLGVHRDFNIHPGLNLKRVANLILFLNTEWEESYGGHLVLQGQPRDCVKTEILPIANRAVIFDTAATNSYHGQPMPLNVPLGINRLSLALYYYQSLPSLPVEPRGTDFIELKKA
jgi:hypothetical protein